MSKRSTSLTGILVLLIAICFTGNAAGMGVSPGPGSDLQKMINSAKAGETVVVPDGTYSKSIEIKKPITLKGSSADLCILEVTGDRPAILINTAGKGEVKIENMAVKWQLKTSNKAKMPYAVSIKDSKASISECKFIPLGNSKRSPVAIRVDGFSDVTIDSSEFRGFEYTVCYGAGTAGAVKNCVVSGSGHQGITLYSGAEVSISANIITDSKYHGVRNTGGKMVLRDNILAGNLVSGAYLGNKNAEGSISNNLFIDNKVGVMSFYRQQYDIANNVIIGSTDAAISFDKACMLNIDRNILTNNNAGMTMYDKRGGKYSNTISANVLFGNSTDIKDIPEYGTVLSVDPLFVNAANGDFSSASMRDESESVGLTDAKVIAGLWKKWKTPEVIGEKAVKIVSETEGKVRIGVYDSRSVAIAYVGSKWHNEILAKKEKEMKKAKESNDEKKIKELDQWGQDYQHKLHLQGFSTAPVGEYLAYIKKEMPKIAKEADVDVIVSKWAFDYISAKLVTIDVTDSIVRLYEPNEKTLKTVEEMKKIEPVAADKLTNGGCD